MHAAERKGGGEEREREREGEGEGERGRGRGRGRERERAMKLGVIYRKPPWVIQDVRQGLVKLMIVQSLANTSCNTVHYAMGSIVREHAD